MFVKEDTFITIKDPQLSNRLGPTLIPPYILSFWSKITFSMLVIMFCP